MVATGTLWSTVLIQKVIGKKRNPMPHIIKLKFKHHLLMQGFLLQIFCSVNKQNSWCTCYSFSLWEYNPEHIIAGNTFLKLEPNSPQRSAWLNRWKMEGVDFSLENTTHLIGMTTKRSWQIKYSLFSPDHITLVRNWFHSALYFPPSHCPHAQPSRSQVSSTKGPVRINSWVMKASQLK